MTDANSIPPADRMSKRGRLLLQMLVGAVLGGSVTYGSLMLIKGRMPILDDPQRLVAIGIGLIFFLMGLFVAVAAAIPRPGSVLLNVEDEEELREPGPDLRNSALMCGLIGIIIRAAFVKKQLEFFNCNLFQDFSLRLPKLDFEFCRSPNTL